MTVIPSSWEAPQGVSRKKAREVDFAHPEEARGCPTLGSSISRLSAAVLRSAATPATRVAPLQEPGSAEWTAAIAQSDGFVFVTPEYNNDGPSAVAQDASTGSLPAWKPQGGLARELVAPAIRRPPSQQLRENADRLPARPAIRSSVHIFPVPPPCGAHYTGCEVDAGLAESSSRPPGAHHDLLFGPRP